LVPAGSWHNVTNIGDEPMQVYTVYAPQHHGPGKVQQTKVSPTGTPTTHPPTGLFNQTRSPTSTPRGSLTQMESRPEARWFPRVHNRPDAPCSRKST
jgi:hypothetical protein